jgi:hypothetical protein
MRGLQRQGRDAFITHVGQVLGTDCISTDKAEGQDWYRQVIAS